MKYSILWNQKSIKNWKEYVENEEAQILNRLENIRKDKDRIDFYQKQINEAIAKHKDSFDDERFLQPKREARK